MAAVLDVIKKRHVDDDAAFQSNIPGRPFFLKVDWTMWETRPCNPLGRPTYNVATAAWTTRIGFSFGEKRW